MAWGVPVSLFRRAKRRDATEPAIIRDLRRCGFLVRQQDLPDLMVRRPADGRIFLLEVDGITKNRKRDGKQLEFLRDWQIPQVKNFAEAFAQVSGQQV